MVIRAALLLVLAMMPVAAAAQEVSRPAVSSEAPALPVTPEAPVATEPLALPAEAALPLPSTAEAAPAPTDLAHLVLVAHPVVQGVMAVLAASAFAALTILVHKLVELALANRRLSFALTLVAGSTELPDASDIASRRGPADAMLRATLSELNLAKTDPALIPGTGPRTRASLDRIEAAAVQSLRSGTGVLASIGAIAPFVGLFGTVFGIMNSFLAIAETRTTNLAVVAPGIAEALLATAIGLAAAIPAVLFYNLFSRRIASHRRRLGDLATALEVLQSRALDRLAAQAPQRA
ncbi:MAG: tonB-system energizer ExbB [Tabrizicola sp.]